MPPLSSVSRILVLGGLTVACAHTPPTPRPNLRGNPRANPPVLAEAPPASDDVPPAARVEAVRRLPLGEPDSIPRLIAALSDSGWAQGHSTPGWHPVGVFASDSLGFIGAAAIPALIETLSDPNEQVRALGARSLRSMTNHGYPEVEDALLRSSFDPAPTVRAQSIQWLSLREDVIQRQLSLLSDPDPSVRAEAMIHVASRAQNPNVPSTVRDSVLSVLAPGTSIADLTRADDTCHRARAPLRCRLRHTNPQVRGDAIREARDVRHLPLLVALLGDPFTHYRSGTDWSEGQSVGARASDALAEHGSAALPLVSRELIAGTPWARREAAACLALVLSSGASTSLGDRWPQAVAALVQASSSEDPLVVLAAIAQPVHAPPILARQIQLLRSDDERVRIMAWQVLERQRNDTRWSPEDRARIAAHLGHRGAEGNGIGGRAGEWRGRNETLVEAGNHGQ